jgi:hypothetical protein
MPITGKLLHPPVNPNEVIPGKHPRLQLTEQQFKAAITQSKWPVKHHVQ